jgi:SAM-dependent methyltransferase
LEQAPYYLNISPNFADTLWGQAMVDHKDPKQHIREAYGEVARTGTSTPAHTETGCCGGVSAKVQTICGGGNDPKDSLNLGYTQADLDAVGDGANLGLGCGNPVALAALQPGQVVVDLGSGAGFDCFLAAKKVSATGHVIGVDMTPDMLAKARANAQKLGLSHVEFRLGEIEHLPVANAVADVVISNCVVNLSNQKQQVFHEIFRVLKPAGRIYISDVVALKEMPENMTQDMDLVSCCIGGAELVDHVYAYMEHAGFIDIHIDINTGSGEFIKEWVPGSKAEDYVASAKIMATKPKAACC